MSAHGPELQTLLEEQFYSPLRLACGSRGAVVVAPYSARTALTGVERQLSLLLPEECMTDAACDQDSGVVAMKYEATGRVAHRVFVTDGTFASLHGGAGDRAMVQFFPASSLSFDGAAYAPAAATTGVPVVVLDTELAVEQVLWLPFEPLAWDERGQAYGIQATEIEGGNELALVRFSSEDDLYASVPFATVSDAWAELALGDEGTVYVIHAAPVPPPDPKHPLAYVGAVLTALDSEGAPRWRRAFEGPRRPSLSGVRASPDGGVWVEGRFSEWVEVSDAATYGHVSDIDPLDLSHDFMASFSEGGAIRVLEAMGKALNTGPLSVLPTDTERAIISRPTSSMATLDGDAENGAAIGFFDGRERAPRSPWRQPDEDLRRVDWSAALGEPHQVVRSGTGEVYGMLRHDDGSLSFIGYPDGDTSPPFVAPQSAYTPDHGPSFALYDDQLAWLRSAFSAVDQPRVLDIFRRTAQGWELSQTLPQPDRADRPATLTLLEGWLFVVSRDGLQAYTQTDGVWSLHVADGPMATSVAFDGERLFVGDAEADYHRQFSGKVYVYDVEGGTLIPQGELVASDARPFDPGLPCGGDYCPGALLGEGFGHGIAVAGRTLVVSTAGTERIGLDRSRSYVFEYVDGEWREVRKLPQPGVVAAVQEDWIVTVDSAACRGETCDSGQLHHYRRVDGVWTPIEWVAPHQRWRSVFGSSTALHERQLLVAAPGWGSTRGSSAGATFVIDLDACDGFECWAGWLCPFDE